MTRRAGDGNRTRVLSLGNVSSRAQARALCCLVQQAVVALFAAPLFVGALSGGTAAAQPRMVDYQSGATLTGTKPTLALRISFSVSLSSSSKPVCLESWAAPPGSASVGQRVNRGQRSVDHPRALRGPSMSQSTNTDRLTAVVPLPRIVHR